MNKIELTIITPCFNEEKNILDCAKSVSDIMRNKLPNVSYEHIFIDNDSEDDGDNPQEDEIQNKLGESGDHLSAFDQNLATLSQAWQVKSTADKEKLRAQYELEKQP